MATVMPIGDAGGKLRAFGLEVHEEYAHDIRSLHQSLEDMKKAAGPAVLVSNSEPWRGFSFLEARWKTTSYILCALTPMKKALLEQEVSQIWQTT